MEYPVVNPPKAARNVLIPRFLVTALLGASCILPQPAQAVPSYTVTVTTRVGRAGIASVGVQFSEQTIAGSSLGGAVAVATGDINGDGTNDVIGAANIASNISWWAYENASWIQRAIVTNLTTPRSLFTADLDTNGTLDVLAAHAGGISCWLNGGGGASWTTSALPSFSAGQAVWAADVNADGHLDVLGASQSGNQLACWLNDGTGTGWSKQVISAFTSAMAVAAADINTNGYTDVVALSYHSTAGLLAWWQNDGSGTNWTRTLIATNLSNARALQVGDFDGDGKMDVVAAEARSISWWKNDGSGQAWTRQNVATGLAPAIVYSLQAADVNGNGFLDVVAALDNSVSTSPNIAWWQNDGSGTNWTFREVDNLFYNAVAVCADDLNQDGRLDLVGAAYSGASIKQWQNFDVFGSYAALPMPIGSVSQALGSRLAVCVLTNPVTSARTQEVCAGWAGTGSAPPSGTATNTGVFVLDTNTQIEWLWDTQYYLDVAPLDSNGLVSVASGWQTAGAVTSILAGPAIGHLFAGWSGQVPPAQTNDNPLMVTNDQARTIRARFSPILYTITTLAPSNGWIFPTGETTGRTTVAYGGTRHFDIIPATGYRIAAVYINGQYNGVGNRQSFINVRSNHALQAAFEPDTYFLYVETPYGIATPSGTNILWGGASVTCSVAGSPILNGATQRVICTGWSGTGDAPSSGTQTNTGAFTLWRESSVTWRWSVQYWLDVSAANGTLDTTNQWCDSGSQRTLAATPDAGYRFNGWSGDVPPQRTNDNPLSISMGQARSISVVFGTNNCRIESSSGTGGSLLPSGTLTLPPGSSTSFTAVAASGWRIASLSVDGLAVSLTNLYAFTYAGFTNVITDHAILAAFAEDTHTLLISSSFGNPSPSPGAHVLTNGTVADCSIAGSPILEGFTQRVCLGWAGNGSAPPAGIETNTGPFSLTNDSSVIWKWQTQYYLELFSTNGSLNLSNNWFVSGAGISITPSPASNYWFSHWEGDLTESQSNAPVLSLAMNRGRTVLAHFTSNRPAILATSGPNGAISPTGTVRVTFGGATNFNITPAPGYRIADVLVDGISTGRVSFFAFSNVRSNHTIHAMFEQDLYELSVASDYGSPVPATGIYALASFSNITAFVISSPVGDAFTQQVCLGWTGTGSVAPSGTALSTSFILATNSVLTWIWQVQYWLETDHGPNGTVDLPSGWFNAQTSAVLTAVPDPGWRFSRWIGDLPDADTNANPLTLSMDQSRYVMAHFSTNRCWITPSAGAGGVVTPSNVVSVLPGTNVTFIMVPDSGWRLTNLLVDGVSVGTTNPYTFYNVINDHSITAEFGTNVYELAVASALPYAWPEPGTNWFSASILLSAYITNSPVGDSRTQYLCRGWTGAGSVPSSGLGTNTGHFLLTNNSSVAWIWSTQFLLNVSYTAYGTVDVQSAWHTASTNLTLTALPNSDARFVRWAGAPTNLASQNPLVLWLDMAYALTAEFSTDACHIAATSGDNGIIQPGGLVAVLPGSSQSFTNVPAAHFRVADVLVDGVSSGRLDSYTFVDVRDDHDIYVSFEPDVYALTVTSAQGTPIPSNGTHSILRESVLACSVEEPMVLDGFTRHILLGWTGAGSVPASGISDQTGAFTFTTNSTITWNWKTQHFLEAAVQGTNGVLNRGNGWFDHGSNVTLTATPITQGYRFGGWMGDVPAANSNQSRIVLTMDQARTVTATFNTNPCQVVATSTKYGAVTPAGTNWFVPGSDAAFTNVPDENCALVYWVVDGLYATSSPTYTFSGLIEDHTLHAVFDLAPVSLMVGSDFAYARGDPEMGLTAYPWSNSVVCRITNSPTLLGRSQYTCLGWTGTGAVPGTGTNLVTPAFALTNDSTILWNWQTQYFFSVQMIPPRGSVSHGSGWQSMNSIVVETATPNPYWLFAGWTGETNSANISSNQITLPMNQPRSIQARFSPELAPVHQTPLWWLAEYGLTNFSTAETEDPDGDRMATWEEYVTGTDPTNALSFFAVNEHVRTSGGGLIQWNGHSGRLYTLHATTSLWNGAWTILPDYIDQDGVDSTMLYTNTLSGEGPLFHRVRVILAP